MGRSRSHCHLPRDPDCGTGGTSRNVHLLLDLQDCFRTSGQTKSKLAGKTLVLGYHAGDWRAVRRIYDFCTGMVERKHPVAGRRPSLFVVVPGFLQCTMGLRTVLGDLGSLGRDNEGFRKSRTNDRLEERKMMDRPPTNHTLVFACKAMRGAAASLDTSN